MKKVTPAEPRAGESDRCRQAGAQMKLVLDTNVVLDWLVFRDPVVALLESAVAARHAEALTHVVVLEEFRRVLAYQQFKLSWDEQQQAFDRYSSQARLVNLPAEQLATRRYRRASRAAGIEMMNISWRWPITHAPTRWSAKTTICWNWPSGHRSLV